MLCLCGKPTNAFWRCDQDPGCGFSCPEDEARLYDRAVKKFLATKQDRPKCCTVTPEASERNYAKFGVSLVPNGASRGCLLPNFGRPFFACPKEKDGCTYFEWGDEAIIDVPLCQHGEPCSLLEVMVENPNKGRWFLCCPEFKKNSCGFFQWFKTSDWWELDGEKVNAEFHRLDEENPFYAPRSSSFEREREKRLERVKSSIRIIDEDGVDVESVNLGCSLVYYAEKKL